MNSSARRNLLLLRTQAVRQGIVVSTVLMLSVRVMNASTSSRNYWPLCIVENCLPTAGLALVRAHDPAWCSTD